LKSALIFGGKSPLALATAREFAANGFELFLIARNSASLAEQESAFATQFNCKLSVVELDISNRDSLLEFVSSFQDNCPDVVISVLGRQQPANIKLDDIDTLSALIEGNFTGPAAVLEQFATLMEKAGKGTLIGISSVAGERGRQKNYSYGAAKAGFTVFLSGLRNRLAKSGVHVMTVKPGVIQTEATASLQHPSWLVRPPEVLGRDIYRAFVKRKNTLYTPWFWAWIMLIIKLIPEPIFKRLNL
jgi:decaprenylphospho-beta-D-erythro-pentofuranosid-2-ulose 2-reductase